MQTILIAFRFAILMMLIGGIIYPFTVTGLGQLVFPNQANGSLIKTSNGIVIGSLLIGQNFNRPEYFHPRLSANNYDAANSGGSNLGSTNKKLIERIIMEAHNYEKTNSFERPIPIDAVTTSASGLDPHISVSNALAQVPRIAIARKMPSQEVKKLVMSTKETTLAETPYVNVLRLNLMLEQHVQ